MDKYIIFAGRKVPISMNANVFLFSEGSHSAYTPESFLSSDDFTNLQSMTASGRCWSNRTGFGLQPNQFAMIKRPEIDALGQWLFQIALHYDVTDDALKAYHALCMRGLSTHFDINYNGDLYQFVDPYHRAIATGANNDHSVAIDVNNPYYLNKRETEPAAGLRDIIQGKIHGHPVTMLGYTEAQYDTLIALMKSFITPIKIQGEPDWIPMSAFAAQAFPPMNADGDVIQTVLRDPVGFRGFLGHFHCTIDKIDPGPAFDWKRVLSGLKGKRNSMPILIKDMMYRNLSEVSAGQSPEYFERYYKLAERADGGWYPVGMNQSWHSGVHLSVDEGTEVHCMFDGRIVALRFCRDAVDLGDCSFVLVQHDKKEVGPDGKDVVKHWYSLYMHLKHIEDPKTVLKLPWASELFGSEFETPDSYLLDGGIYGKLTIEKGIPQVKDATNPIKNHDEIVENFCFGHILLTSIPVEAGTVLGHVGMFGSRPERLESQVHIEVFSEDDSIFQNVGSGENAWVNAEGESSDMSLMDVKSLLKPILRYRMDYDQNSKYLKTSEISSFYQSAEPEDLEEFRKLICYHRSEWSPSVNWTQTAVNAVGWQWETEKKFGEWLFQWLPFQWMTKDLSAALKFPKDHCFYTYHPIYLLQQLNMSYTGDVPAATEEASEQEIEEARQAEQKRVKRMLELNEKAKKGEITEAEIAERNELQSLMNDDFVRNEASRDTIQDYEYEYDAMFDNWEPGEWMPPGYQF